MMGEYLIVSIEIPLAFYENGPGGRIEFVEGMNEPHIHGLLQAQERSWRYGDAPIF
jgi:hypothetical protein